MTDVFAVLAEPRRREIVEMLRQDDSSVNDLVARLKLSQPAVSKHLRVLRDSGLVSVRPIAQQRIYRLEVDALRDLDTWLAPYRAMWNSHLDALAQHLNEGTPP